ncbi:Coenzyme A biosynthesis bifunctional protein CoaBC [Alphaproteobacteria bacterium]
MCSKKDLGKPQGQLFGNIDSASCQKNVLLIATGSIATYKLPDLIRNLEAHNYNVSIILTQSAQQFVTITTLRTISRAAIYLDNEDFLINKNALAKDSEGDTTILHIALARKHDVIVVAPASANYIAKMAVGFADTLSLSTILATSSPIIVAPAMNPAMFAHQATQHNINLLQGRNVEIIGPIHGQVACQESGCGKYVGNEALINAIDNTLKNSKSYVGCLGRKAVITVGNTREYLDPVRFIGNFSTGRQGILIAQELVQAGYDVTVICGFVDIDLVFPKKIKIIRAYSAREMLEESIKSLPADIFIGCAAISDFKPRVFSNSKIKKTDITINIELEPNVDVVQYIATLGQAERPKLVAGFALETGNYLKNGQKKLQEKALDLVVVNRAEYLGKNSNEFIIITRDGNVHDLKMMSKGDLARHLVALLSYSFD